MQRKTAWLQTNRVGAKVKGSNMRGSEETNDESPEEALGVTGDDVAPEQYANEATTMLRKPGVDYELKLIEGSGGQLGLVEVRPEPSFFIRWFLAYGEALRHHDHFM